MVLAPGFDSRSNETAGGQYIRLLCPEQPKPEEHLLGCRLAVVSLSVGAPALTCSPVFLPEEDVCRQRLEEGLRLGGVRQKLGLLLPSLIPYQQEDVLLCCVILQRLG